jgi:hypothetical protein
MAIFTLWALGSAAVGAGIGLGLGLISCVISLIADRVWLKGHLPPEWSKVLLIPILGGAGWGVLAGFIVGMYHSFTEATWDWTMELTFYWTLPAVLTFLIVIIDRMDELSLEEIINTHPSAEQIYAEILQSYELQSEQAEAMKAIDEDAPDGPSRSDVMREVMSAHGLMQLVDGELQSAPDESIPIEGGASSQIETAAASEVICWGCNEVITGSRRSCSCGARYHLMSEDCAGTEIEECSNCGGSTDEFVEEPESAEADAPF